MDQEPNISFWGSYKDHSPKDSFFENLLTISYASSNGEVFPLYKPNDYVGQLEGHFEDFLKGCLWNFQSRKDNPINTYFYFKYILNRLQICKGAIFSERGGSIMHILLPNPLAQEGEGYYKSVYYLYGRINEAISILEEYLIQLTPRNESPDNENTKQRVKRIRLHGFKMGKEECINLAYDRLRYHKLIHFDVSFKDFRSAFSDWIPDNKIIWLEGPGLLSYFIKSINGKGIEDEKKNIWTTTINCFQDKDSKNFTVEQLRFAKKPTKTDDIDSVIKSINRNSGA